MHKILKITICSDNSFFSIIKSLIYLPNESWHNLIVTFVSLLFLTFFMSWCFLADLLLAICSVNNGDMIRLLWMEYFCLRTLMIPNVT